MDQFFLTQNLIEAVTARFGEFERVVVDAQSREPSADTRQPLGRLLDALKTKVFACALSVDGLHLT